MGGGEILTDAEKAGAYIEKSVTVLNLFPGETDPLKTISHASRLSFWTVWGFVQGRRKTAQESEITGLRNAYLAFCDRALRRLEEEIALERGQEKGKGREDAVLLDIAAKVSALAVEIRQAKGG